MIPVSRPMSRFHSYILSASKIIETYVEGKPLSYHVKHFFSKEKKYGSRDRKMISSLCYNYFRLGHALKKAPVQEKILAGTFLAESKSNEVLSFFNPDWNERIGFPVTDKLLMVNLQLEDMFPFTGELTDDTEKELFVISFLQQPDLFLRARPGKTLQVIDKLKQNKISFEQPGEHCFRLVSNTSVDAVLDINKDVVIQDMNSQKVLNFLEEMPVYFSPDEKIAAWDCCAASGGKSILLYDILADRLQLTVSDIRENILNNLSDRLHDADVPVYKKIKADLSRKQDIFPDDLFSIILCDAPCTGSGTWSRTPEQMACFNKESIEIYAGRQKQIITNTISHLMPGGLFFYITCSVFKKENEEVVNWMMNKFRLKLLRMEYLKGYDKKADTMFVAVLRKT